MESVQQQRSAAPFIRRSDLGTAGPGRVHTRGGAASGTFQAR